MKKNGFQCPLNILQVLSWIIFSYIYISGYILITSSYKNTLWIFLIIYTILFIIVLCFTIITTIQDPTDANVKNEIEKKNLCKLRNENYVLVITKTLQFCIICCSNIYSNSKHCKECNRCVDNFDHHCKWLNNCIGKVNYKNFIFLVISIFISISFSFSLRINIIIQYYNGNRSEERDDVNIDQTLNIINLVSCCFEVVIIVNVIYLLIVHIYFKLNNLTTYEYIVQNKDATKNQSEVEIKQQDTVNKKNKNKFNVIDLINKINNENKDVLSKEENNKIIIKNQNFKSEILNPIIQEIYSDKKTHNEQISFVSKLVA